MTDFEGFYYGDTVLARFEPKRLETLRSCMAPLIGKTFEFEWGGFVDDGPYAEHPIWYITRKHDLELPNECKGRWVPTEDLIFETTTNPGRP